jgi:hypothetical protein
MKAMRIPSILFGAALLFSALRAANFDFKVDERNPDPKGIHIASRDDILEPHEPGLETTHIKRYYLVDHRGKRCSGTIEVAILPVQRDYITVQWLDHQNSLVVINNRHKFFQISAFARNPDGFYGLLRSKVDDYDAMGKIARALLKKADPSLSAVQLEDDAKSTYESVDVDSLKVDDTGVKIPVLMEMRNDMVTQVQYKFDHFKLRFIRQSATLLDHDNPTASLSGAELDKVLKR